MLYIWILVRLARALRSTLSLLTNRKLLQALPWLYIQRLPRTNLWIGTLVVTIGISTVLTVVALAVPGEGGAAIATTAFTASLLGITSSWLHGGTRRWQRRHRRQLLKRAQRRFQKLRRA